LSLPLGNAATLGLALALLRFGGHRPALSLVGSYALRTRRVFQPVECRVSLLHAAGAAPSRLTQRHALLANLISAKISSRIGSSSSIGSALMGGKLTCTGRDCADLAICGGADFGAAGFGA